MHEDCQKGIQALLLLLLSVERKQTTTLLFYLVCKEYRP